MSPYEAVLRSFAHFQRVTSEEHAPARAGLERAVQLAPGNADCWAMLSLVIKEEYTHGFNLRPDPLGLSRLSPMRLPRVKEGDPITADLFNRLFEVAESCRLSVGQGSGLSLQG